MVDEVVWWFWMWRDGLFGIFVLSLGDNVLCILWFVFGGKFDIVLFGGCIGEEIFVKEVGRGLWILE